ncbi:hypothetical protein, partial [Parachitinimonas caeni]
TGHFSWSNTLPQAVGETIGDLIKADIEAGDANQSGQRKSGEQDNHHLMPNSPERYSRQQIADAMGLEDGDFALGDFDNYSLQPVANRPGSPQSQRFLKQMAEDYAATMNGLAALKKSRYHSFEERAQVAESIEGNYTALTAKRITDYGDLNPAEIDLINALQGEVANRVNPMRHLTTDPNREVNYRREFGGREIRGNTPAEDIAAAFASPWEGMKGAAKGAWGMGAGTVNFVADNYARGYFGIRYALGDESAIDALMAPGAEVIPMPRYSNSAQRGGSIMFNVAAAASPFAVRAGMNQLSRWGERFAVTAEYGAPQGAASEYGRSISIFGVRGGGESFNAEGVLHPYQYTGHVGYSFDSGKVIWGFGPSTGDAVEADIFTHLKSSGSYPGIITADQEAFRLIAENPLPARGSSAPQVVYEQKMFFSQEEFDVIRARHEQLVSRGPMDDIRYQWPPKSGNWPPNFYNCATFPSCLGIPIPETTGKLQFYMPALEAVGAPWKPIVPIQ